MTVDQQALRYFARNNIKPACRLCGKPVDLQDPTAIYTYTRRKDWISIHLHCYDHYLKKESIHYGTKKK